TVCPGSAQHAENTITFTDNQVPAGSLIRRVGVTFYGSGSGDNSWTCTVKAHLNGVEVTHYDIAGLNYCGSSSTQPGGGFGLLSIPSDYPNGLTFFNPGGSNTLRITVDVYQPTYSYCGRSGLILDMVLISVSYEPSPDVTSLTIEAVNSPLDPNPAS